MVDSKKENPEFDRNASEYNRSRPTYPSSLIDDLIHVAHLDDSSKILEVGMGTGQLTRSLADRKLSVTAVEMGKNLVDVAKIKFSEFPEIEIIEGNFEKIVLKQVYDAVIFATSFKWIDPELRVQKVKEVLKKDGILAIIDTHHAMGGDRKFFTESQDCYLRWRSGTSPDYRLPEIPEVHPKRWERETQNYFETIFSGTYQLEISYTSSEYRRLLSTYSDILSMGKSKRDQLLDCISTLIDSEFNGKIRKLYLFELFVAKKKPVSIQSNIDGQK